MLTPFAARPAGRHAEKDHLRTHLLRGAAKALRDSRRIAIVGCGGAGKSTLARSLGQTLGVPVHHLDVVFWRPHWQHVSEDELVEAQRRIVASDAWILDGSYARTLDLRLERAQAVVLLDLPRYVCLWRVVKRVLRYRKQSRPDMAPGCPERLDLEFLLWIWRFPAQTRPEILTTLASFRGSTIRLRSKREVTDLLNELWAAGQGSPTL